MDNGIASFGDRALAQLDALSDCRVSIDDLLSMEPGRQNQTLRNVHNDVFQRGGEPNQHSTQQDQLRRLRQALQPAALR